MASMRDQIPSMKPAEVGDTQYYVNLLNVYRRVLIEKMDVKNVLPELVSAELLTLTDSEDFHNQAKRDRKESVHKLLEKLSKRNDDWFSKFKMALKNSRQNIIFNLLDGKDTKDEEKFEKLLCCHFVLITDMINPMELLPVLYQRETITKMDKEEIESEQKSAGNSSAAMKLLSKIPCRKNGWFTDFVVALKHSKYNPLLESICPELLSANSDESIANVTEKVAVMHISGSSDVNKHSGQKTSEKKKRSSDVITSKSTSVNDVPSKLKKLNTDAKKSSPKSEESFGGREDLRRNSDVMTSKGKSSPTSSSYVSAVKGSPSDDVLPNLQQPSKISTTDHPMYYHQTDFDQEGPRSIVALKTDDELKGEVDDSSLCSNCNKSGKHLDLERSKQSLRGKPTVGEGSSVTCDGPFSAARSGHCSQAISSQSEAQFFDLSLRSTSLAVTESGVGHLNQLSQNSSTRQSVLMTSSNNLYESSVMAEDDGPIVKELLVLRDYQKELAEKAVEGRNCIIVSPTGSGKTHVALYISKRHLECIEDERKILFFVPKVALVQQQRRQYQTYMNEDCKVCSVSGENDVQMSLKDLIDRNDVIVMTPQILINAIDNGEVEGSFSQVTLMIFDECHHAMKDHPYNNIMSRYMDILLSGDEVKIRSLPQIVGLTASPGVGKAKSDEAAVEHIINLFANLAASDICTVTKEENLKELQIYVNVAVEGIQEIKGRRNDPFEATISRIMAEIERKMIERTDNSELLAEAPNLLKALQPPAQRGHDSYTQFLALLKREVAKIYRQEVRRYFISCQEHLDVYNNALLINADCRTIEAFEFIKKRFSELQPGMRGSLPSTEVDRWLTCLFEGKALELEAMSTSPESANPKLKYLEDLILGYYKDKKDSQGIIFCKTRFMTDALVKWMQDTPTLRFLNPHILVGAGSTTVRTNVSMTRHVLDDVLKHFKGGVHKIIVSTSVAEEGLDVKSCNYVIRYEHVTNDIARVQSRGRARADDAKYAVVAGQERGIQERELVNQFREELMTRAIHLVHQLPEEQLQWKILAQQQSEKCKRETVAAAKAAGAMLKASRSHEGDYELRCYKCDALGVWATDLRVIKGCHHVVIDREFKDRIRCEPHPRPKQFDDIVKNGKIECKECGYDWGISALYKNVPVYLLKVCSFVVQDADNVRLTPKKWKEVPFVVDELSPEDMKSLASVFSGSVN